MFERHDPANAPKRRLVDGDSFIGNNLLRALGDNPQTGQRSTMRAVNGRQDVDKL